MSDSMRPYVQAAKELGVIDIAVTRRTKHILISGKIGDKTLRQIVPVSGSDNRGLKNTIAQMRRAVFQATGKKPWLQ